MSSYNEWYEAISSGDHAKKRKLMYERMDKMRASSKLSPEVTEEILAIYKRASLRNLEIGERNEKKIRARQDIGRRVVFVGAILFTILAIMASH